MSLSVRSGEFVALVGRSGCGKTTLLRILTGLTEVTRGQVRAQGQPISRNAKNNNEVINGIVIVLQDANLFLWYTVEENIASPLKLRGESKQSRWARTKELCELIGLSGFERRYPRELSGGCDSVWL